MHHWQFSREPIPQLDAIDSAITTGINLIFEKVRRDPFPTLNESMQDVYA